MEGQISLFQLNSKGGPGGPVSLEENDLKHTQPLSNIHFIKIGKKGRGREREIQVEHNRDLCLKHMMIIF